MITIVRTPVLVQTCCNVAFWGCSEKGKGCIARGMGPTVLVEFVETKQKARVCLPCFNAKVASDDWAVSGSGGPAVTPDGVSRLASFSLTIGAKCANQNQKDRGFGKGPLS
jgi:hypothetical protein